MTLRRLTICVLFTDIIEEITSELTIPDEKEPFNFATYNPKSEKQDEDLWSPKKLTPYVVLNPEDIYTQPKYPTLRPSETFIMSVPCVRIMFEMEQTVRVPVLMMKVSSVAFCDMIFFSTSEDPE